MNDIRTYAPDDPANPNNLVVRGRDGDPLPHPSATLMIEKESYERVIEGLKMAADACAHLAKIEPLKGSVWQGIAQMLDRMRHDATLLAGIDPTMKQAQTQRVRGEPVSWRAARDRFLDGLRQAAGGMRQLATCFRGDFTWSMLAQQIETREKNFRRLLAGAPLEALPRVPGLILPPGFQR